MSLATDFRDTDEIVSGARDYGTLFRDNPDAAGASAAQLPQFGFRLREAGVLQRDALVAGAAQFVAGRVALAELGVGDAEQVQAVGLVVALWLY